MENFINYPILIGDMGNAHKDTVEIVELYAPEVIGAFLRNSPPGLTLEEKIIRFRESSINLKTWFFRDVQVLDAFQDRVLPTYPSDEVVHVASVGCSDGREAYSLLLNNWGQRERLRIEGFDVNPSAIEAAVAGEYEISTNPFDGELKHFKSLGLVDINEAYELIAMPNGNIPWLRFNNSHKKIIKFNDEAKKRVNFHVHDILMEPLPQEYDVILLLNMLMHYNPTGRERVLSNVFDSMKKGGWLLCETTDPSNLLPERQEYFKWMKDLERFGFEAIREPQYTALSNQTAFPQVYIKREALRAK
jgi:chemotaxis methyl-accepting protein methylase